MIPLVDTAVLKINHGDKKCVTILRALVSQNFITLHIKLLLRNHIIFLYSV